MALAVLGNALSEFGASVEMSEERGELRVGQGSVQPMGG
jgi:hypothetical protein